MTDSTQYKYVTQDSDGWVKGWKEKPNELLVGSWLGKWETISSVHYNSKNVFTPLLIDLSTHDYDIVGGKLIAIQDTFQGSELQYQTNNGEWHNCGAKAYRIKPKTKLIRYRTYLTVDGEIEVTYSEAAKRLEVFKEWAGEWQEAIVNI